MPAPQTSYTAQMAPGLEGMLATGWGGIPKTETRLCETVAGIAFGRVVGIGATQGGALLGGASHPLGITIRDITLITQAGQTVDLYQRYNNMGILNQGDIWVRAVAAVALGDYASYDATTGQLSPASAGIAVPTWRYQTAAGAGALAVLRLGATA